MQLLSKLHDLIIKSDLFSDIRNHELELSIPIIVKSLVVLYFLVYVFVFLGECFEFVKVMLQFFAHVVGILFLMPSRIILKLGAMVNNSVKFLFQRIFGKTITCFSL